MKQACYVLVFLLVALTVGELWKTVQPEAALPADRWRLTLCSARAAESPPGEAVSAGRRPAEFWRDLARVLSLRDYNTRVVLAGTVLLGTSAGLVGVFMMLRRRSLIGDVVSHASLPGIAIAFLVMESVRAGSGKSLPGLLLGALLAGLLGVVSVTLLLRYTRIRDDAASAVVLSVFFGLGIALFTVIQDIPTGNAAGLGQFIFGKAASLVASDVRLMGQTALAIVVLFTLLFKEFALLSFDARFATSQGWPVFALDLALMAVVAMVTVIGLQSVGLLLVVGLMIIPPAAARFWTDDLKKMALFSAGIGALSAALGVLASALYPRLAAGAVIVLCGSLLFCLSLLLGPRRGILPRLLVQRRLRRAVGTQHLLRAFFELLEPHCAAADVRNELPRHSVSLDALRSMRSWSPRRLNTLLARARGEDLVVSDVGPVYRLTQHGAQTACRVVRNHRLWEMYLIEHADIAASHVDRDADNIEHVLGADVVAGLEKTLAERYSGPDVPPSPHSIQRPAAES